MIRKLQAIFGKPVDARLALHKIHDISWQQGESVTALATRIQELYFQAHPELAAELRESCAGDTF